MVTIDAVPGPYVDWLPPWPTRPQAAGPLHGVRLAVKDLFDLAGLPTGAGNPTWLATHPLATRDAPAVAALAGAGARIVGKTHTDEMAFSFFGTNAHYGAPDNPAAPGHLTGGSSSGSAAAVADGSADLGLGTDTGGSVRVPASWCGLYGLRPTHARVSRAGIVPLAASFDVPGLFTTGLPLLRTAAAVLLAGGGDGTGTETGPPRRLVVPAELWALADPAVRDALAPAVAALRALLPTDDAPLFPAGAPDYRMAYGVRASWEFWQSHGAWVTAHRPAFGPNITTRISDAGTRTAVELAAADREIATARTTMDRVLADAVMLLPSTPVTAPRRLTGVAGSAVCGSAELRGRILGLTGLASLLGLPALSLPVGRVGGHPVGLCLVGAPGSDEALLALADALTPLRP